MGLWKAAVENIGAQNVALVFTHCDEDAQLDVEYAEEWYNDGMLDQMGLPEIRGNRIFLFKGENGQGGARTTPEEITQWVSSVLPPPSAYARLKPIDYASFINENAACGNEAMTNAISGEIQMLKAMAES